MLHRGGRARCLVDRGQGDRPVTKVLKNRVSGGFCVPWLARRARLVASSRRQPWIESPTTETDAKSVPNHAEQVNSDDLLRSRSPISSRMNGTGNIQHAAKPSEDSSDQRLHKYHGRRTTLPIVTRSSWCSAHQYENSCGQSKSRDVRNTKQALVTSSQHVFHS